MKGAGHGGRGDMSADPHICVNTVAERLKGFRHSPDVGTVASSGPESFVRWSVLELHNMVKEKYCNYRLQLRYATQCIKNARKTSI